MNGNMASISSLSSAEVEGLPVDKLALEILADFASGGTWNADNWVIEHHTGRWSPGAIRACAEAIDWLRVKGLIARTPASEQSATGAVFVTRLGRRVLQEGRRLAMATERIGVDLHPKLEAVVRPQFLMGEYETACFVAMKQVEIRVRELAGESESLLGVKLAREAFKDGGPLSNPDMDPGERVARMELFAGGLGSFKNPTSHREVRFDDPTEAAEVILFGDLLMRILDRVEAERRPRNQNRSGRAKST